MKKIVSIILMVVLFNSSLGITFAGKDINNAFCLDESELKAEYVEKYKWEEEKLVVRKWNAMIAGIVQEFERLMGYQTYYLRDHISTTQRYLYSEYIATNTENVNAAKSIISVAKGEINTKESPKGSNKVKYNEWFYGNNNMESRLSWDCTFISWCANECGFIGTVFIKTASTAAQYDYLTRKYTVYQVRETISMGGSQYTPVPGDIVFYLDEAEESRIALVSAANTTGICVIEGDKDGKVKKTLYKNSEESEIIEGEVVHIVY